MIQQGQYSQYSNDKFGTKEFETKLTHLWYYYLCMYQVIEEVTQIEGV